MVTKYKKCRNAGASVSRDFTRTFEGRLAALGRADKLISPERPEGASLTRLLDQELAAVAGDPSSYSLEGPDIALHPDCALAFSLLVHELAANAREHGSLSADAGRVDVGWRLEDGDLVLAWTESGGPPARAPQSPGFGNLLIADAAVKLKGTVDHLYKQSGLICNLRISLLARWPRRRGAMLLGASDVRAVPAPVSH
jgi:two-component sensor histidine kinase